MNSISTQLITHKILNHYILIFTSVNRKHSSLHLETTRWFEESEDHPRFLKEEISTRPNVFFINVSTLGKATRFLISVHPILACTS